MKRSLTPWLLAAGTAAFFIGGCGAKPAPQPNASPSTPPTATSPGPVANPNNRLKVIAFYDQSMGTVTPDPFALAKAHPGLISYLAPFWYEVSSTGSIISKPEGNAATLASQDHLRLIPLFNNAGGGGAFLTSASTRMTAVNNIVTLVKSKGYAGASIDFQLLKSTDRADLTLFMQSLQRAMPKGDTISMSVVPLTSGNGQSSAYDFRALDKVVNSMVLMAYDLHGNGTPPGPVAPFAWVKRSIQTALNAGIQRQKLYLGIANYGYLWKGGSTKAATIPLKTMHQHKYGTYRWQSTYQEAYDKYTHNGETHIIWFENDRAAVQRIALAKQYHLGGVAFWRIGYEDARWWNAVANAIGSNSPTGNMAPPSNRPSLSPQQGRRMMRRPFRHRRRPIPTPARKNKTAPSPNSPVAPSK